MGSPLVAVHAAAPLPPPSRRPSPSSRRRGSASILGMLYLMIFAALALGFYAQTNVATQLSGNERRTFEAQVAAESATQFARHLLDNVNIPAGFNSDQAFDELYTQVCAAMEGTANLGTRRIGFVRGTSTTKGVITIPENATDYISLGRGQGFRVIITDAAPSLDVKVVGAAGGGIVPRAIKLEYRRAPKPYALVGIDSLNLSGTAFTDSYNSTNGAYGTTTPRTMGSVASNGNITLADTARISGDAFFGPSATLSIAPGAQVRGMKLRLKEPLWYPSVTLPPAGTYTDMGDVNVTSGTHSNPGGTYVINNLTLGGNAVINWQGPVTLYIKTSYTVSDNVVINTYANLPKNRKLFFLPTCTTASWSGSNTCVGELYAPDTHFTISGNVQKMGYVIARTINNSSGGGMHYDEALLATNGQIGFGPLNSTYTEVAP